MDTVEMIILRGVYEGKSLRDMAPEAALSQEGVRLKLNTIHETNPGMLVKLERGKAHNWRLTDQGVDYLRANGMLPTTVFRP